ncbi:MAG: nucleotidyltransferase domain-containing protein, partial [Candidatus Eisenbacteria bacterium]
ESFYLLQCRPQSFAGDAAPAPIPRDLPVADVIFTADRYVSNGWMPDITHLVYVDPLRYSELESRDEMVAVGRAVGQLNKLLPKRQFILMGPGRWGSRGDIRLGVSITYADINNTAMLIEIARQKGQYLPDVSFGTHFFQDLVESRIRYLPLYPDDPGIIFNDRFLLDAPNLLPDMLPGMAHLADVLRVIDVAVASEGRVLRVLMNAELEEAVGVLGPPDAQSAEPHEMEAGTRRQPVQYWRWRMEMVEKIAQELDRERFGVIALYVFGSVKNATAGPASDIDLLVHFRGDECKREALTTWLEGWSLCLAEMNYLRTGYRTEGLLDVHIVTDDDIAKKTSYAAKIDAVTDAARHVEVGKK